LARYLYLFFCFLFLEICSVKAQITGASVGADSVSNAVFPVLSYSSTEGFVGGAVYNRYDFSGNIQPFKNYLQSSGLVSTKGFVEIEGKYERTRSFGKRIRTTVDAYFHRYTADIFFGIGNEVPFSKSRWDNDYYYFQSVSLGLEYKLRKALYQRQKNNGHFDLQLGLGTEYQVPYVKKDQSSFAQRMPYGYKGGWINYLTTGFVWENRDSEFDPHHGNRAEFDLRYSPELISKYGLTSFRFEYRQYFYLLHWLTVANRLETRYVTGNIPYWEMSTLGGENDLRGYPLNRFMGNASIAYTLELRAWFFKFPRFYNLKLGGQLFTDTGRVFTGKDNFNDVFHGYKQTFGFGGAMSMFNPDFILRGEIGFSDEVARIYIGIGYLF